MDLAHLHLLLNHFPTVGLIMALGVLVLSLVRKDVTLRRVSLEVLFVVALLTLPTYLSGMAAQPIVLTMAEDALPRIEAHHSMAMLASFMMLLTGAAAWLSLWRARRTTYRPDSLPWATLVLALVTLVLMARAGTMGGEIRHPEIMAEGSDGTAGFGPAWLTAPAVGLFVNERTWLWPALETLHFIGLWVLFGVILVVNLRLLGMMKATSYAALHRLLPWAALALATNIISGMLFTITLPDSYIANISFHWKMGLFAVAGLNLLYLTAFDQPWEVGPGEDAPAWAKTMAVSAIGLWVGVMYFGRMLPFIGNSF
jgi:uncharacterized membrane protein